DDAVVEVATDKVDSEVRCEGEGILVEKRFNVDDVVQVGDVIAIIETEGDINEEVTETNTEIPAPELEKAIEEVAQTVQIAKENTEQVIASNEGRFYSPLVKNIAKQEGISQEELDAINGTGIEGRVTKDDILAYIAAKSTVANNVQATLHQSITKENRGVETLKYPISEDKPKESFVSLASSGENEILEMSRMGKIIANHMVESVQTSVHVQSYIEVDVTNIWNWRNKVKDGFKKRTGE